MYEYNTRDTYGKTITGWTANDPLNATWWHLVTEGKTFLYLLAAIAESALTEHFSVVAMEADSSLVAVRFWHNMAVESRGVNDF